MRVELRVLTRKMLTMPQRRPKIEHPMTIPYAYYYSNMIELFIIFDKNLRLNEDFCVLK